MKDRLEQFIDDNRDSFDSFEKTHSEEIWTKISRERQRKQHGKLYLRVFMRVAAIALIFGLSYLFHDFVNHNRELKLAEKRMNDIYQQLPELKEAENYYSKMVSGKWEELMPSLIKNPGLRNDVNADFSELDSIYLSLKNDLKDNVANEQIIEAMIQNYRLKLQILEELQAELQPEKNKNYEEHKIHI